MGRWGLYVRSTPLLEPHENDGRSLGSSRQLIWVRRDHVRLRAHACLELDRSLDCRINRAMPRTKVLPSDTSRHETLRPSRITTAPRHGRQVSSPMASLQTLPNELLDLILEKLCVHHEPRKPCLCL